MTAEPQPFANSQAFLGLGEVGGAVRMELTERVSGGLGSLFGGAGLAAAVSALETASGMAPVWVTTQFVGRTTIGDRLDLDVDLPAQGRTVTQGQVTARVGDAQVFSALGACGERPELVHGVWRERPDAPAPQDCQVIDRTDEGVSVHDHVDSKIARGMFGFNGAGVASGDNSTLLWLRMPELQLGAAVLALLGDYMASALGNAFGRRLNCTSLDNSIRYCAPPTVTAAGEWWVLAENRLQFAGQGFATGESFLWGDDGQLLAIASQSMSVREMKA